LREVIPNSYGQPLHITISLEEPVFVSVDEAEDVISRAANVYLDMWPNLHVRRRMGYFFQPFLRIDGPAFQNIDAKSAVVAPARGERGKRFFADLLSETGASVIHGFPKYFPAHVAPPRWFNQPEQE
jgi:hypothetical protein